MKTGIEGLLLYKTPYQDRHLIGQLLLRSGRLASVLFYGGQGGGKRKKPSLLELGSLLSVELTPSRSTVELYRAKEWKPCWIHDSVRYHHRAFCLMCFYLEIIRKIAPLEDLSDENLQLDCSHSGLFRVLSNALFYLKGSPLLNSGQELLIFLGKLLIDQGLFPQLQHCGLCHQNLNPFSRLYLGFRHGSFLCPDCYLSSDGEGSVLKKGEPGRELWSLLGMIASSKYQDLGRLELKQSEIVDALFHYFCFQFNFHRKDFRSVDMVL